MLGSYGRLTEGPKPLMEIYGSVLTSYSMRWTILPTLPSSYWRKDEKTWTNGDHLLQVLLIGNFFVVGAEFDADEVAAITGANTP